MRVQQHATRHAGFTLIELLVVVAIIAVLLALSAGTYFRLRTSQLEQATVSTLTKLASQHSQQWKAVLDQAKQDVQNQKVPTNVVTMSGDDSIRTRVVWSKFHQKMAFPQNAWEVVVWAPAAQNTFGISQNATYRTAFAGILPNDPNLIDPNRSSPPLTAAEIEQLHLESAALLYLSLTQPRRGQGADFNPVDHVGAHAIGEVVLFNRPFKVFQDSWLRPIAFVRWPFGAFGSDLNGPGNATMVGGNVVDPTDPERRLLRGWNQQAQAAFIQQLQHPLPQQPVNLSPVIFSGGRDKDYGVNLFFTRLSAAEDDNVYSYRVHRASGN